MVCLNHSEAQFFRILSGFFGEDRVVLRMRVIAICGGSLPESIDERAPDLPRGGWLSWAQENKCLFTIVDDSDEPRMVIEFFSGFDGPIDPVEADHQRFLKPLLAAAGVNYITISSEEFSEILDPDSSLDIYTLLKDKVEMIGLAV